MAIDKKIYILHGWTYSLEKWKPIIELLNKNGVEVVMLRVPGLTVPHDKVWQLDDYVEWVKGKLEEEELPIVLLGHSNGGRISIAFAAKYPKKIKKLILIDSAGIYHNEFRIKLKRFVFEKLAKIGKGFSDSETLRNMLYKFARVSDYQKADSILRKTMLNLIRTDISNLFPKISAPTTIIWGEKDDTTPLVDGKLMHEQIKGSKLFVICNTKHSPHFTNIEEVGEIILNELEIRN